MAISVHVVSGGHYLRSVVLLEHVKMKEFDTSKTMYLDPKEMGLKTTIKVVSGNIIESVRNSRFNVVVLLTIRRLFWSATQHNKQSIFKEVLHWSN